MPSPQWIWCTQRNMDKAHNVLATRRMIGSKNRDALILVALQRRDIPFEIFSDCLWPFLSEKLPPVLDMVACSIWVNKLFWRIERMLLIQYHTKCLEYLTGEVDVPRSGKVRCTCIVDNQVFIWNPSV
jgi:hypothetical protein